MHAFAMKQICWRASAIEMVVLSRFYNDMDLLACFCD
jgi:hypothetical protein